ncbi:MAG: beta strand repeat-containing protein, partial [Acidobacteriota bacterium]
DSITNQITECPANANNTTLQLAYDTGNTIDTTDARDIAFTLTDTTTDSSLTLTNEGTANAFVINDTNAGTNTSLAIQSGGVDSLTITENGTLATSGNIATTGSGTITSAELLTASNGFTQTTGALNLTATSGTLSLSGLSASSLDTGANNLLITSSNLNVTTTGINATVIGTTTPSTAAFTTLSSTGNTTLASGAGNTFTAGNTTGALTLNGSTITANLADNATNAFTLQQGTDNYFNFNTTDGSENVAFGNTTTNPTFSFLGTGPTTFGGNVTTTGDLATTGNFDQTGSGTFSTGTGNISLNGATSVTGSNSLTVGSGATDLGGTLGVTGTSGFTGLATFNGGATVTSGQTFTANGASTFAPNGTNDIIFTTDADSLITIAGLQTASGSKLCLDGSNNLVYCNSQGGSLQQAYDEGNSITTTDARDIAFVLDDTATDANFAINMVADNTVSISRQDDSSTEAPPQLLLLENLDTDLTIANGLLVNVATGGVITNAINVSDNDIVNALNLGANTILGTSAIIDFTNFDVDSSGNTIIGGTLDVTSNATFNNNIFQTGSGTLSTGTGNVSLNGATSVIGTNTFSVGTGATTLGGTLAVTGNTILSGNLAINGGNVTSTAGTVNLFNATPTTINFGNAATAISLGANAGTTTINNNLSITDTIDVIPVASAAVNLRPYGGSAGTSELRFYDSTDTNYTAFRASSATSNSVVYTLPANRAEGTDYVLSYQENDTLEWRDVSTLGNAGDITQVGDVLQGNAFDGTAGNQLFFEGTTPDGNETLLVGENPTQDETIILPANSGTLALIQPRIVQDATDTTPLLFINEAGTSTPNLLQLKVGGTDAFAVDNNGNISAGGTLATTATTGNLFNTDVTTLNIGGAATTITIGASSGITTFNTSGVFADDLAVNGGDITTTAATASLFNTNATTINFGSAATSISLGAGTGTITVNNNLTASGNFVTNGSATIGDGGDAVTVSGSTVDVTSTADISLTIADNLADAFDLQQGMNNYLNINTTDSAENVSFGNVVTNPNYSFLGTGATTLGGNLDINGGTITTTASSANIFNTNATTFNIGGEATAVSLGAGSGSTTINNNLVAVAVLEVRGGDLTTNQATFALLNDTATTIAAFGAATTIALGAATGTTTINNNLYVTGNTAITGSLTANSGILFQPGGTDDITFLTDNDSILTITGLPSASGNLLCINNSTSQITKCASDAISLQQAYAGGNTIESTDARDIAFTLADTTTDANFSVTTAAGGTGYSYFALQDGTNTTPPAQLALLENLDVDEALSTGFKIQSEAGGITTAIDVSDAEIGTALSFGANDLSGTNFSISGATGNLTTSGDFALNGGDLTSSASTFNLLNSSVTTLNIGDATTAVTIGAGSGTATINNQTISFPNATALNAGNAALTVDSGVIGGGYGSTGVSVSNTGTIQANGNLTIDGTATLTGNVTTAGDLAVNGDDITSDGDLTITAAGGNIILPHALNVGGAATANYNFFADSTAGAGNVNSDNDLYVEDVLEVDGSTFLTPTGTADVTIATDADSDFIVSGLTEQSGELLCVTGTDVISKCDGGAISLQSAYDGGNSIISTDNRDIAFTLDDTATDANFTVTTATGSTGGSIFRRADGAGTADPSQLVLIDNADTDRTLPIGLKIQGTTAVTTAIDLSDPEIVTALALGGNDITGTNFSLAGTTGNIISGGDIALNGGDITTTNASASLFNTSATTLNVGGAATSLNLGATTGTATINNATINFANATTFTADTATASFDSLTVGGGYGTTGVTLSNAGTIQANGNLTIDGTSTLTGNTTMGGDLAVNDATSADITSTTNTASLFNSAVTTLNIGGAATTINVGATGGTTTVTSGLTVASGQAFTANGASTFNPDSTNDVIINTDADSNLIVTGLGNTTGSRLCVNSATSEVAKCDSTSDGLQASYDAGNT